MRAPVDRRAGEQDDQLRVLRQLLGLGFGQVGD
jgi:hypothetical protein